VLECSFKKHIGVECMGCGFQRSLEALFHGDLLQSIQLFPATIPLISTVIFTILHLVFRFKLGHRWIVFLFALSASLMLIHFILKISNTTICVEK
jgi:hypothetical protein